MTRLPFSPLAFLLVLLCQCPLRLLQTFFEPLPSHFTPATQVEFMEEELLREYEASGRKEHLSIRRLLDRVLDRFPGCLRMTYEQWRDQRRKALRRQGLSECELLGGQHIHLAGWLQMVALQAALHDGLQLTGVLLHCCLC